MAKDYGPYDPRSFYAAYEHPEDQGPVPMTVESVNRPAPTVSQPGEPDQRVTLAHKLIENVGEAFGQHRQAVDAEAFDTRTGRTRLEPDDHRAAVQDFARRPEVQQQIDKAVELVADARAEAQAEVDRIRAGLIPQRDTAAEIKAQRDWARTERLLDSAKSDGERAMMAKQMLEQIGNPAEFATAVEEFGPYLRAHGLPTEWLESTITARIPALGVARQQLSQAERDLTVTKANAAQQRRMLETGHRAGHLVDPAKLKT